MNILQQLRGLISSAEHLQNEKLMVLEGRHLVLRYLGLGGKPLGLICVPSALEEFQILGRDRFEVVALSEPEIAMLLGFPFHRGVLALAPRPEFWDLEKARKSNPHQRLIVGCPRITDEANLGAILRSCLALGIKTVLLGPGSADPFSRKTLRTSMGASLGLILVESTIREYNTLKMDGYTIVGASLCPGMIPLNRYRPQDRQVLVLGHETLGIPDDLQNICDVFVGIPMSFGVDSLNVAVSAGIILYRFTEFLNHDFRDPKDTPNGCP